MNVLIACEESQRVCISFRERGHNAFSCDVQECSGGRPEWHIMSDVLEILNPTEYYNIMGRDDFTEYIQFQTMDGALHKIPKWDLIIAHPPCTYLSNAGACRLYPKKGILNNERYMKGLKAKHFFLLIANADCKKICIENPIPSKIFDMPPYTQIIQPYQFGEPYSKKTCLWLKCLPQLHPTEICETFKPFVSCGTSANKGKPEKAGFSRAGGRRKSEVKHFGALRGQWRNNGDNTKSTLRGAFLFYTKGIDTEKYLYYNNSERGCRFMMTAQEFSSKAAEVLTKLESPEDVGGLLESLVSDFTARDAEAEKLKADYDEAIAKIDRLQRANMELFLRTGVKGAADADTVPDDDEGGSVEKLSPDFSAAMDDKGNIL